MLQEDKIDYKSAKQTAAPWTCAARPEPTQPGFTLPTCPARWSPPAATKPPSPRNASARQHRRQPAWATCASSAAGNQRWLVVNRPADKLWSPVQAISGRTTASCSTVDQEGAGHHGNRLGREPRQAAAGLHPLAPSAKRVREPLLHRRARQVSAPASSARPTAEPRSTSATAAMVEVYSNKRQQRPDGVATSAPRNLELENEFLRRLMVKLGVPAKRNRRPCTGRQRRRCRRPRA